ncbi:uncharacterized protein LOC133834370 isoform X2 [Humulus lupulus]|uniref:uncharacterized protein LOC133834370 isoform X2 n=1 Tax=Humulus lupulus TaxID=3486 RepID=UPI002B411AB6|nr:uncharacterized protein LOC133834370 isoform X2 [Humulus lupulus]
MMGFGPYGGNGGSYLSPSSSSLSASAPPFTIDRSGPKPASCPLVDLAEPSYAGTVNSSMYNWLPSLTPTSEPKFFSSPQMEHNSGPSSNAYGYGGSPAVESSNLNTHLPHLSTTVSASVDGFSYGLSSDSGATGFVEAKPYYPSFFSSAGHKDGPLRSPDQTSYDWLSTSSRVASTLVGSSNNDQPMKLLDSTYAGQWGDMWNGFAEWKQGKQGQLHGSFCSKENGVPVSPMCENYMNQESHNPKGLNRGEEASCGPNFRALETHSGYMNLDMLLNQSFTGKTTDFMPVDHSKPILGSFSGLQETHLKSPSFIFGTNSGNHQIPYGSSNEKRLKQKVNNSASTVKSSSALVIGPPAVGSGLPTANNVPFKTLSLGSNTHADISSKMACGIKDSHSQPSFGDNLCFDSSRFGDPVSSRSIFSKKDETLNKECITNDPSCQMLKVKSGLQTSNVSHDGFNLDLNANESINSVADSSESVEHFYPFVDSPCWKGVTRSSPFVASEDVTEMRKRGKQTFPFNTGDKVSSEKATKNIKYQQFGCLENSSEIPLNISSTINSESRERKSDDVANPGYYSETKGIKHSDENHEHGSRSIGSPDLKSFQATKQDFRGDGLASENINDTVQYSSLCLHFPVEHVRSPSVKDASSKLTESNEGQSTPTVDVLMLVNTISNLSELLLSHCTSGLYKLQQKDLESVQSTINNLSVCMSKNAEKTVSAQAPTSSEKDTSDCAREQNNIHKGVTEDSPKLTKTINLKALFDGQNLDKGKSNFFSGQKDDEILDSASVKSDLDMEDEDKATQALKKVLAENFHDKEETEPQTLLYKNLWLEAEAALCSLNYKARYNRMKMEMEKFKLPNSFDARENIITIDMKKPSSSEACPDQNTAESPKTEGSLATKSHESPVLSTNGQADDVIARFHVLKCRLENSNSDTVANVDKPSSSQFSSESTNAVKILTDTHEEKVGSPNPDVSLLASSMSDTNSTNKFEASVLARFHILKSRVDNHIVSTEVPQSPNIVNLGYSSENRDWPYIGQEARSSDVQPEPTLEHRDADSTEGQLIGSDFDMLVNDDPSTQSDNTNSNRLQNENLLYAGWLDRVSSDWEHVRKEEYGLQVPTAAGDYYE